MARNLRVLSTAVRANTKNFERGMKRARSSLRRFAGAISVYLGARALKQRAADLDAVAKASDKLGIASERLMGLHHAAELSGVSVRTFNMAIQRMTRRVAEAAMGTGEARGAIKELGLDARQLKRAAPDEMLRQIADAMERVESQADKVRLAMKLFDSEGVALVNTLGMTRKGLDAAQKELDDLGATLTREELRTIETLNDNLTRLGKVAQSIGNQILQATAPIVNYAAEMLGLSKATDRALLSQLEFKRKIILGARHALGGIPPFGPGTISDLDQEGKNLTREIDRLTSRINKREDAAAAGAPVVPGKSIDTITTKVSNLEQTAQSALGTLSSGFDVMSIKAQGFNAVLQQVASSLASMASQTFAQYLLSGATGGFVPDPFSLDVQRAGK